MVLNMGQNVIELSQYRVRDHFPELRTLGITGTIWRRVGFPIARILIRADFPMRCAVLC